MKLKVLVDNNTYIDEYYLGEPAVSYYIEDGKEKILFDTGYSDAFLKNASKMGIDINRINKIIISHGHDDHTGGLQYLLEENLNSEIILHPDCICHKEDSSGNYIGSPITEDDLSKKFKLTHSKKPLKISDNVTFLGEIPTLNDFEPRKPIGNTIIDDKKTPDILNDDTAIVCKSPKGLFIITGCSHSGICNICEYAKTLFNNTSIYGIIGGFHLFKNDKRLKSTINNIELLYPCHCVSLEAKIEIAKQIPIHEVGVGLEIEI